VIKIKNRFGRLGERTSAYSVIVGKPEEKYHLKELSVDGRIILKLDFQEV
jgi:hypothetical protein